MIVRTDRLQQNCALTSLNQMARNSETALSFLRGPTTGPVVTRLGSLPKLPLQDCARARSVSLQSDSAGCIGRNPRNWKIIRNINWFLNTANQGSGKASAIQGALNVWTNVTSANHVLSYGGTTTAGGAGTGSANWAFFT